MHDGERQAGIDAPAVDDDRAGAALAVVAALLGAGQVQVLAQRVEQRGAGVEFSVRFWPFTWKLTLAMLGASAGAALAATGAPTTVAAAAPAAITSRLDRVRSSCSAISILRTRRTIIEACRWLRRERRAAR
jgi:hypothetical protein